MEPDRRKYKGKVIKSFLLEPLDEAKQLVRESLCRDCKGTGYGQWDCTLEDDCDGFREETEKVLAEEVANA